jgi:hypothetical protein
VIDFDLNRDLKDQLVLRGCNSYVGRFLVSRSSGSLGLRSLFSGKLVTVWMALSLQSFFLQSCLFGGTSLASFAFVPGALVPAHSPKLSDRICTIRGLFESGRQESMSGIMISKDWILSVAHFSDQPKRISATCPQVSQTAMRVERQVVTPNNYRGFNLSPKGLADWTKFDIGLFRLKSSAQISEDIKLHLGNSAGLSQGPARPCLLVGTSPLSEGHEQASEAMKVKMFQVSSNDLKINEETYSHRYLAYSGAKVFISGDSGGPVLCQRSESGIYDVVGLLQYSGKTSGPQGTQNIVGIIDLTDDLVRFIRFETGL